MPRVNFNTSAAGALCRLPTLTGSDPGLSLSDLPTRFRVAFFLISTWFSSYLISCIFLFNWSQTSRPRHLALFLGASSKYSLSKFSFFARGRIRVSCCVAKFPVLSLQPTDEAPDFLLSTNTRRSSSGAVGSTLSSSNFPSYALSRLLRSVRPPWADFRSPKVIDRISGQKLPS